MRVLRPLYFLPLAAFLWAATPLTAMESRTVDSFHKVSNQKKPLQDTTVTITVTKGGSYRELSRQAILAANNDLCAGQLSGLNTALYGKKEDFPTEQQWVEDMIQRALEKWPKCLPTGEQSVLVPAYMRLKPLALTAPSAPRPFIPASRPSPKPVTPAGIPPWTGGTDDEFAQWITQFTQSNFTPNTWKEKQRAHITPEVVISVIRAEEFNITKPAQQQQFAETLIKQALKPETGDPGWWKPIQEAYLDQYPGQTTDAALFSKKIMVEKRRIMARKLIGVPENALYWKYSSNPTRYSDNADRLSYTPDELIQVLRNTVAASKGEVTFDEETISITRTVKGNRYPYQTSLTLAQFIRWVAQETDNCPFVPGSAGERSLIHLMAGNIDGDVCGRLDPLVPENGILMAFRWLAYMCFLQRNNDTQESDSITADAVTFTMYNGGARYQTQAAWRVTLAENYGNYVAKNIPFPTSKR